MSQVALEPRTIKAVLHLTIGTRKGKRSEKWIHPSWEIGPNLSVEECVLVKQTEMPWGAYQTSYKFYLESFDGQVAHYKEQHFRQSDRFYQDLCLWGFVLSHESLNAELT
jgi:hypothetical protein